MAKHAAQTLIEQSARTTQIVSAKYDPEVRKDLMAAADDFVANAEVEEYWGTLPNGDEWRVHLVSDDGYGTLDSEAAS